MKRLFYAIIILLAGMMLSNCSIKPGDVNQVVQDTTIVFDGSSILEPAVGAEEVLQEAFRRDMGIDWIPGDAAKAQGRLEAISYMFQYMQDRRTVDGTLPYYIYKTAFEFIRKNYLDLEPILDRRVGQGVLTKAEKVVYTTTKRDIKLKLEVELQRIKLTEAKISDDVSSNMIDNMKRTYEILKPLINLL